jgi:two-component system, NarL family, sensor histidine kinase UhpB
MSMFWRVFAANAAILIVGTLVLVVYPGPLHEHRALFDLAILLVALLVMVVVNGLLLRHLFRPLQRLAERMEAADVLRGGQRLPVDSVGEIGALERTFNRMLERLEKERRDAGAHALQAQEAERQRLARGLHDEIGQSMTAVLLQLKRLTAGASPEQRAQLAEAQEVVKASLDDVRRLAQELRPELLDHLGLASALAELASAFEQRTHVGVQRQLERDLPPLDPQAELVFYRVTQESLTNVARHAQATQVLLALERGQGSVVLRVIDNGQGFEPEHVEGGGLRGIRERALIVGGAVAIKPGPDGGVEVRLEVPTGTA